MKIKNNLATGMIHSLECLSNMARYDEYFLHFVLFPLIREQSKLLQKLKLWEPMEETGLLLWQYPLFLQKEFLHPQLFEHHLGELVNLCRNLVYGEPLAQNGQGGKSELSMCSQFTAERLDKLFTSYVGTHPNE